MKQAGYGYKNEKKERKEKTNQVGVWKQFLCNRFPIWSYKMKSIALL